jgi:ribosomal protein L35
MPMIKTKSGAVKHLPYTKKGMMMAEKMIKSGGRATEKRSK